MKRSMISIRTVAALLLTVAAVTACSNDDIFADESTPVTTETPRAYTLTVKATKSGNDAGTRALTLEGNTLNATWKAGEEVAVYSVTGEGSEEMESIAPVGTLTAQSSGATAMLKGSFEGYTPTEGARLRLRFCSAKYDNQKGTLEYIASTCDYAKADVTITDVTDGEVTTTAASFENQQAIVKFTLKKQDGTTPVSATSLTVNVGSISYDVSPDTPASEIFVAIPAASNKAVTLKAISADGNFGYEKTGVTFEKGKYYSIGVKMTRIPTLGDLYYSDGTFSTTLEEGKTPIGVIAYVGTDAFTENGVTLRDGTTTLQSHGLVLCLKQISHVRWRHDGMLDITDMTSEPFVDDTGDLKRTNNVSGYANTKFLAEKTDAAENYPAAYQAWNYSLLPAPSSTTGWFLPSIQQWVRIMTALGGMSESDIVWRDVWKDTNLTSIHNLEAAMEKAGAKGTAYDAMSDSNRKYWSSSEASAGSSAALFIYPKNEQSNQGILFSFANKVNYYNYYVRPVLAF